MMRSQSASREIHDVGAPRDARVVHEDVDTAERRHHPAHHLVDGGHIAHVRVESEALATERGDGIGRGLGRAAVGVGGDHVGSRPGQGQRSRVADAVARSGDDGDSLREHHAHDCNRSASALSLFEMSS